MSRLLDLRAKEPYTRLSRVSPALHTLRQGKGFPPLFVMYFTGTYMARAVQVQANRSCFGSIVFALFGLYTAPSRACRFANPHGFPVP